MRGDFPKLRPSRPADWGANVTVCIAAMANSGGSIIIAADQMISTQMTTADGVALKIFGVHPNWAVMSAGDMTQVAPILYAVRESLKDKEPLHAEVERAVVDAYKERLITEEEDQVLGRFGLTVKNFLSTGLKSFGDANFSQIVAELGQITLGVELLAAGYDVKGLPHIFSVSHPGKVENHDVTGFWAIGSGQYSALGSLYFHSYNKRISPQEALFHVCEAKFMAERASGVGPASSVLCIGPEGRGEIGVQEIIDLKEIRKIWEKEARPRMPKKLRDRMAIIIGTQGVTQRAFLGIRRPPSKT